MFNHFKLTINSYVEMLQSTYRETYGILEPEYPNIIGYCARAALENIANSDCAYHDIHHTMLVTEVGQEIIRGRHIAEGGVRPIDWLHQIIALLCHDIGYVRGVCQGDTPTDYIINQEGDRFTPPAGSTDVAMTPFHVERSKIFVRERFGGVPYIDAERICKAIELTRFPVPDKDDYANTQDFAALVRAADLIGQMADLHYLRKTASLWREFEETGTNVHLGYSSPADLRANYPAFWWNNVKPYIGDAINYLQFTQDGKQWIANLYANVFSAEHNAPGLCR